MATPAALAALDRANCSLMDLIRRHARGDWSGMKLDDVLANRLALVDGSRVFSSYTVGAERFWVITEAGRHATTVLVPFDY